jgi:hypothetical protein
MQPTFVRVICAHLFPDVIYVQVFELNHIDQVHDFEAQKAKSLLHQAVDLHVHGSL